MNNSEELLEGTTIEILVDALGCFWNAAIGEAHNRQSSVAMDCAAVMAEGVAAVACRLDERRQMPDLARQVIHLTKRLAEVQRVGNRLSIAAQTSGGVAGRDDGLVAAIEEWGAILAQGDKV